MAVRLTQLDKVKALFEGWQETILWSCQQGVMGDIFVDTQDSPSSAMAVLGDFCFLAGRPDQEMVSWGLARQSFIILVPKDKGWAACIEECYATRAKKVERYATKKEPDVFDRRLLEGAVSRLPAGYQLKMIDERLFRQCQSIQWCQDWVSQYPDYAFFQEHGLGAVILKDGEPVSGASSYSSYMGGIEVEVDTRQDCRRQGLAYISGAKLILECLARGWYPSWDAQNQWSLALAEKLGYHFSHTYPAYEVYRK